VLPTFAMVKYKILQNSVQWEPNCSMWTNGRMHGWTDAQIDRHDEANSCFLQFCECM